MASDIFTGERGTRNLDLTTSSPCTSSLLPSSTPSSDITSPPILLSSLLQLLIVPLFPFTTPLSQITSTLRIFTSFTLPHLLLQHHHHRHLQQQPQQPPHHQRQHFQFHQEQKVAKTTKEPQLDVFLASTNKASISSHSYLFLCAQKRLNWEICCSSKSEAVHMKIGKGDNDDQGCKEDQTRTSKQPAFPSLVFQLHCSTL